MFEYLDPIDPHDFAKLSLKEQAEHLSQVPVKGVKNHDPIKLIDYFTCQTRIMCLQILEEKTDER